MKKYEETRLLIQPGSSNLGIVFFGCFVDAQQERILSHFVIIVHLVNFSD